MTHAWQPCCSTQACQRPAEEHLLHVPPPQKKKGNKKGKIEVKKELMSKLNDDEKNDLVSLEIELVQAEVEQVRG